LPKPTTKGLISL